MLITEFCEKYGVASIDWGLSHVKAQYLNMDDFFYNSNRYNDILWAVTRKGVLTQKEYIQFNCWCVNQVKQLLKDDRSKQALIIAEKYLDDDATDQPTKAELDAAMVKAQTVYQELREEDVTTYDEVAIIDVAYAVYKIPYEYPEEVSKAVAHAADANAYMTYDAARALQVEYLRENFKPNWE